MSIGGGGGFYAFLIVGNIFAIRFILNKVYPINNAKTTLIDEFTIIILNKLFDLESK
jgi:hypothetical protein